METMINTTVNTTKYSTGGILNKINEMYFCNAKNNTVAIVKLIQHHKPKTWNEVERLIESHQDGHEHANCSCGAKSKGTIKTFAKRLHDSVIKYEEKTGTSVNKSEEDCYNFMYGLFVVSSLKGAAMELNAISELNKAGQLYDIIEKSSEEQDFKMGIDLVLRTIDKEIAGVQVKPSGYKLLSDKGEVVRRNNDKELLFGKPVVYLYYDVKTSEFLNMNEVISELNMISESYMMNQR